MLYFNCSVKRLKFAPKWSIFYFQPVLVAIFVTIATVKVKLISDLYTWVIVVINQKEEFGEKSISFFGLIGGPKQPLNARSSFSETNGQN